MKSRCLTGFATLAATLLAAGSAVASAAAASPPRVHGIPDGRLLPRPARDPGGPPAAAAAKLAAQVLQGGNAGVAAMRTALRKSGFGIVNVDRSRVQSPDRPAAGLDVEAGQLIPVERLATSPERFSLSTLVSVIARSVGPKRADLTAGREAVVADLAAAAASRVPTISFFAHFVDDLQPGASILAASGSDFQLTGLQLYLLSYQMARVGRSIQLSAKTHALRQVAAPAAVAPAASRGLPCELGSVETGVNTLMAAGISRTRSYLLKEYNVALANGAPVADYVKVGTSVLSVGIAAGNIAAEDHALKITIGLRGGEPLVRTQSNVHPGESKVVEANVSLDFRRSPTEYENCLATVAAEQGVNLGTHHNGAKGAEANWFIVDQPGAGGSGATKNPVQFFSLPGQRGSATTTYVDGAGHTQTGLQGTPQPVKLPDSPAPYPFMRKVTVGFRLALHPNNLAKDWVSILGVGITGNVISAMSQAVQHMHLFTASRQITVKDWGATYRVDFNSTLHLQVPHGSYDYQLVSQVPLAPDSGVVDGEAPLSYLRASGEACDGIACAGILGTQGAVLKAALDGTPGSSDIVLGLDVGQTGETYGGFGHSVLTHLWWETWTTCYKDQLASGFTIPAPGAGKTASHQTFTATCTVGGATATDTTVITVEQLAPAS